MCAGAKVLARPSKLFDDYNFIYKNKNHKKSYVYKKIIQQTYIVYEMVQIN